MTEKVSGRHIEKDGNNYSLKELINKSEVKIEKKSVTPEELFGLLYDYYKQSLGKDVFISNSKNLINNIVNLDGFCKKILSENSGQILKISIYKNILTYTLKDGYEGKINITQAKNYEEFLKNQVNVNKILSQKEQKEISEGEKVLGGSAILLYTATGTAGIYTVNKLYYSTDSGMKPLELRPSQIYKGTKEQLRSKTLRILESSSIFLDGAKMQFEKILPYETRTNTLKKIFQNMTYDEYIKLQKQTNQKIVSKEKFEKLKIEANLEIFDINTKYREYLKRKLKLVGPTYYAHNQKIIDEAIVAKKVLTKDQLLAKSMVLKGIGTTLHLVLMPTFFENVHHNSQDAVSSIKSLGEYGSFEAGTLAGRGGAAIASRTALALGKNLPGYWKLVGPLAGGIAGIAGYFGFGVDKWIDEKSWKLLPEREDFGEKMFGMTNQKSLIMHTVTNYGIINDGLDKVGGLGVFGKIDLSTNPREFMSAAYGRDVDHRNKQVDKYKQRLHSKITGIVIDYINSNKNTTGGNKMSQEKLIKKFDSAIGSGEFLGNVYLKNALIEGIVNHIKEVNFDSKGLIDNVCEYMKLDNKTINLLRKKNDQLYVGLKALINIEANKQKLVNPKKYAQLCELILTRMQNHEQIVRDQIIQGSTISEKQLYNDLLDSKITKDGFTKILNMILEYKRQGEFLNNIGGTGKAVKWGV